MFGRTITPTEELVIHLEGRVIATLTPNRRVRLDCTSLPTVQVDRRSVFDAKERQRKRDRRSA